MKTHNTVSYKKNTVIPRMPTKSADEESVIKTAKYRCAAPNAQIVRHPVQRDFDSDAKGVVAQHDSYFSKKIGSSRIQYIGRRIVTLSGLLLVTSFLILTSANAQEKPSWIDNPQSAYPNAQYLSAVGSGDGRQSAENDAASKLSRIFQSTITSEQTINERYKELFGSPNTSTYEQQTDVNKKSTVASSQTLYNFQIPEAYTDNLGRTYAIAVIERVPTAEIYKEKITENDKIMMDYINRYLSVEDPVSKYADINAASVFSAMNEELKKQLLIIIPGETIKNALGYDDQKVGQMLSEARKEIPFTVDIQNDSSGNATAIVKEMLSDMGFVTSGKGVLTVSGKISFERIDLQRPEQFVRWSYDLSVVDPSGAAIVSLSDNGREGHVTYSEAVARATRTMKQRIKTNFSKEINRYFDSLVRK